MKRSRKAATKPPAPTVLTVPKPDLRISSSHLYRLLVSALPWASTDWTRSRLSQIHFVNEGGKVAMFATDGHGLWFCDAAPFETVDADDEFSFGIPTDEAKELLKLVRHRKEPSGKDADAAVFSRGPAGTVVTIGRCSMSFDAAGDAVPFRKVVPTSRKREACGRIGINAAYLARVAKSLPGEPYRGIEICLGQQLDPMRFDGDVGGIPVSVIVMPLRLD